MSVTTDIESNSIYVIDSIEYSDTKEIYEFFNSYMNKIEKLKEPPEIKMHVSCYGGNASACFAITDIVEQLNEVTKVTAIASGEVSSAALAIWLSANNRVIRPRTLFCYHDIQTWGVEGSAEDISRYVEMVKTLRDNYNEIVLKYTILNKKCLDKVIESSKDWYIDTDEMKSYLRVTEYERVG